MPREGIGGGSMEQHPLWKEFCRCVDEGEFDSEINAQLEEERRKDNEFLDRINRPTTPEDLIEAAKINYHLSPEREKEIVNTPETANQREELLRRMEIYLSLPMDAKNVIFIVKCREDFKKDPANFQKFLRDRGKS
jgi:hypothetical protein